MTTDAPTLPPGFPAMSIAEAHRLMTTTPGSLLEVEEREIRGTRIKTWKNAPPTLAEVFAVSAFFSDRTYMVNDEERVTFDAHRRAVARFAARLIADGVKKATASRSSCGTCPNGRSRSGPRRSPARS